MDQQQRLPAAKGGAGFPSRGRQWASRGSTQPPTPTDLTIEPGTVILGSTGAAQGTLVGASRGLEAVRHRHAVAADHLHLGAAARQPRGRRLGRSGAQRLGAGERCRPSPASATLVRASPASSAATIPTTAPECSSTCGSSSPASASTTPDELNGIALQGVGRGTVVDNVQVNRNQDDGIEFFGGTVNVSNVFINGAEDDSIDWT